MWLGPLRLIEVDCQTSIKRSFVFSHRPGVSHEDPLNVLAFYDNSAGEGKEPEKVPELPPEYPRHKGHPVGFTGGLHAGNVKECLGG